MPKRKITTAERKRQDYLRRRGLQTSLTYERKLKGLRAHEVKRVLQLCADYYDPERWPAVIDASLREDYLPEWEAGLFRAVGVPMAKSTARDLNAAKADEDVLWEEALTSYAKNRAGSNIVIVSGTLKEALVDVLRTEMEQDPTLGVEKLTKRVYSRYSELAKWQVRRIAQTESMIGMADAANYAAKTLDVGFVKIWAISGLGNTRDTHLVMDGWECEEDEPFTLEGGLVQYPHDCSLGAEAAEIINCACSCIRRPK